MKLLLKRNLLKRKLLQRQRKFLKKRSSKRKRQLTSKQMFKLYLKVKNFQKSSKAKQAPSLRVQSVLRLQKSKRNCKSPLLLL